MIYEGRVRPHDTRVRRGGKSLPATKNGSISTIRYFLSVAGARNIRKLANKKYPSDPPRLSPPLPEEYPVRGSRETLGSLFRRNENWLLIPQLVRRRGRGKVCPCIPSGVGWWASIKTYFAGGPSDVNNLALVSFVIIAVTSIWREKFRERGREGVSFDTVWNR